jgi:hypothetical protein
LEIKSFLMTPAAVPNGPVPPPSASSAQFAEVSE